MFTRLLAMTKSIRFRLSVMYSAAVFGLGGLGLGVVNILVRGSLQEEVFNSLISSDEAIQVGLFTIVLPRMTPSEVRAIEGVIREIVFTEMSRGILFVLGGFFLLSLFVGWWIAERTLRPIQKITSVASEISATDLSRRIGRVGPDDELSQLANTFDGMLERLDHAFQHQKRFLAQTSHDLRNPLAIIRSNLELILSDPKASLEDWEDTGQILQRAANRMSTMIEALLSVARLEAGETTRVNLDFAQLVIQSGREQQAAATEKEVRIETEARFSPILGDPNSLNRAWGNLVENALAVSPPGSVLWLRSGMEGDRSYIEVTDQGPGIPPEVLSGVYSGGARGMGLMITREVVRVHQGDLLIEPVPSGGTTIRISLPHVPALK